MSRATQAQEILNRLARMTQANFNAIRNHLFHRIHINGEQMKNDFPNILRSAIETEAWRHFTRPTDGQPFENLVEWLHSTFPHGPMLGVGQHAITYEDALKLTEGASDVHRVLAENAPKPKVGRPKTNEAPTPHLLDRRKSHNSAATLSVRLAQEKPKYYEAYMRGEYGSVTAAAIAAGLIKDDANTRRGKSAYRRMARKQREDFLRWERETDPEAFDNASRDQSRS